MAENFTIENRLGAIADIQRNFFFQVVIPSIRSIISPADVPDRDLVESLIIRTKTCAIPARGNEEIESVFMGLKQFFPGRPTFSNKLAIQIDATEDDLVMQVLTAWRNKIFDIRPDSATAGYSQAPSKRNGMATSIILQQFKYNGEKFPNDIEFVNAWPQEVGDVDLAMAGNEKVTFNITFTYDFWRLVKN